MGIRADRRAMREERERASQTIYKDGVTHIPVELIYSYCSKCEHHRELPTGFREWRDLFNSICVMKFRRNFTVEKDDCSNDKPKVSGSPDIAEDCPCLASMVMDADVAGLYGIIRSSTGRKSIQHTV